MTASDQRGRFAWYDLMTTAPDAAPAFYSGLLGWSTQKWTGEMPYTMWTNAGAPLGGIMQLPAEAVAAGAPAHWIGYVSVPDVDVTATRAAELGATIYHPPTDIPGTGRFAVLADPQGATIAIYSSADPGQSPKGGPKVGDFSWHELITTDHETAFGFYADLFGWQRLEAIDMGPLGIYQLFGVGDTPLGGMMNRPEEMPVSAWLYYVRVADMDAAVARVESLGGSICDGPMEVSGGDRAAQCSDAQGAMFGLHWVAQGA
jgi:hypothetical protein